MKKLSHSINYAIQGISYLFSTQRNARIHLVAGTLAVTLGFWLTISKTEWLIITLCIAMVLILEAFNTAIETLCDFINPEFNSRIKVIKDLSAAAVLISAIASMICGLIIFLPKL